MEKKEGLLITSNGKGDIMVDRVEVPSFVIDKMKEASTEVPERIEHEEMSEREQMELANKLKTQDIMENEEYFCINCAKNIECYGPNIKLEELDLCIPISCIDYQDIEEKFNS